MSGYSSAPHAEDCDCSICDISQLQRCIEMYDQRRAWFREETESTTRHKAINWLSHAAGINYVPAAEALAEALARRAERRLLADAGE